MNAQDRYNSERYPDMTCFLALRNIERNERKERRYTARNMVETCDVLFTNFPGLLEKPDYKDQVIEIMQEPKQYILKLEGETDNEQHENTLQADGGQQP